MKGEDNFPFSHANKNKLLSMAKFDIFLIIDTYVYIITSIHDIHDDVIFVIFHIITSGKHRLYRFRKFMDKYS